MKINYTIETIDDVAKQIVTKASSKTIVFKAEMGMGKTTLIKAIVKALGSKDAVSSPTFSLVNEYKTELDTIYHFDLYRINNEEELYNFGIEEYLDANHWLLIEWPELIKPLLLDSYNTITITSSNKNSRMLSMS